MLSLRAPKSTMNRTFQFYAKTRASFRPPKPTPIPTHLQCSLNTTPLSPPPNPLTPQPDQPRDPTDYSQMTYSYRKPPPLRSITSTTTRPAPLPASAHPPAPTLTSCTSARSACAPNANTNARSSPTRSGRRIAASPRNSRRRGRLHPFKTSTRTRVVGFAQEILWFSVCSVDTGCARSV